MATVLVLLLGPSNCSTLLRAAFSFSCIQASDFTEVCSTQTLLGSPYPLEEVCSSPLIESPLFHLRVVMGCRYFSVQLLCVSAASPVCLPDSRETISKALLCYFRASLMRLEVRVGTQPCHTTPDSIGSGGHNHNTAFCPQRIIKFSAGFLSFPHSEWAKGVRNHEIIGCINFAKLLYFFFF